MSENSEIERRPGWRFSLLEWILVGLGLVLLALFFAPAIEQSRQAARRTQSKNNLKQIGLALHNYHKTWNTFPPGGVVDAQRVPYHCWTTAIDCYLEASPWYSEVNFAVPWDDPTQLDHFLRHRYDVVWKNPRIDSVPPRKDGLPVAQYAGNSWILFRNSSITLKQIDDAANTLLTAEARGHYVPLGCPGNWRDVDSGFNNSEISFGCLDRDVTLALLVDGSVRNLDPGTDSVVWNALAGPKKLRPTAARRSGATWPYVMPDVPIWRKLSVVTDKVKAKPFVEMRLLPDRATLEVDFGDLEDPPRYVTLDDCLSEMMKFGDIKDVRCTGTCAVKDLEFFKRLKNLKRLTISKVAIHGDLQRFVSQLSPSVVVD
ncbi:MAG: hypothetical protein JWM11_1452 [Planctomycetaceae bacterium]|nr:hypothetical protein [Planctomycetaceae bacterium]